LEYTNALTAFSYLLYIHSALIATGKALYKIDKQYKGFLSYAAFGRKGLKWKTFDTKTLPTVDYGDKKI